MKSNSTVTNQLSQLLKEGKNVSMENKVIDENWNLADGIEMVNENEAIQRGYIASAITFKECTFKGTLLAFKNGEKEKSITLSFAKSVSFINCIFEESVSFRAAIFNAPVTFQDCSFLKGANFEESSFINEAYFNKTKYGAETRFQNSVFMKKATWMDARFEANVSFQGATFYNDAQFSVAQFARYADFTLINFQTNSFFNYAVFDGQAIFNSSVFGHRSEFVSTKFDKAEIMNCYFFMQPKFYKNEVKSFIDFSKSIFLTGVPDLTAIQKEQPITIKAEGVKEGINILSEGEFISKSGLKK